MVCACLRRGKRQENGLLLTVTAIKEKEIRQAMFVQRNVKARSYINYCGGIPRIITYSEFVSVALVIQHATRMRHIVIRGLSGCTKFSRIIS
jgi:hypothetical protein